MNAKEKALKYYKDTNRKAILENVIDVALREQAKEIKKWISKNRTDIGNNAFWETFFNKRFLK